MSDKTYVFEQTPNQSVDATTAALLAGRNNNGGLFGSNGIEGLIGLIIAAGIFGGGNGNGLFGGGNNNTEREMLLQAINRNGNDINTLAAQYNCSTGQVMAAINALATQLSTFAGQQGMTSMQIINAIQAGNAALASQLCDCCCKTQSAIQESNYLTERGFCNTNQILTRGFSDLGYAFRDQTCDLKQSGSANTAAIIAKLDAIEDSRKDRELAEKDRMITTLTARSERQAELQPIYNALQEIQCNQPPVKKIACPETYVPVNRAINENYGLIPNYCAFGGYPFNFPYGFPNGNNGSFF